MELLFLGTSAGAPSKARNVSATAIYQHQHKNWCLVDCGEATQHQILYTKLSIHRLDVICITHAHGDHCFGLPGLITSASMNNRTEPLTLIAPQSVYDWLLNTLAFSASTISFPIHHIESHSLSKNGIKISDFHIQSFALSHRVPTHGFCFQQIQIVSQLDRVKLHELNIPKGPLWGTLKNGHSIEIGGRLIQSHEVCTSKQLSRKIMIAGDNDTPEKLAEMIQSVDVLVHESTYTHDISLKVGPSPMHCSAKKIADFAQKHQLPFLILNHISPRYGTNKRHKDSLLAIEEEAKLSYQGGLFIAEDFDQFHLRQDRTLIKIK